MACARRSRAAIADARTWVAANSGRGALLGDGAATAVIEDGLRVAGTTAADGASVVSRHGHGIGGGGPAPSPGWLLRAANASCIATLIAMRAAELGRPAGGPRGRVDSESDDAGILGVDAAVPPDRCRCASRSASPARPCRTTEVREIVAWGVDHCPVCDAVKRAVPVELDVRPSEPGRAVADRFRVESEP